MNLWKKTNSIIGVWLTYILGGANMQQDIYYTLAFGKKSFMIWDMFQ